MALNALNQGQGQKNSDEESDDEQEIGGGEIYRINNALNNILKDKIPNNQEDMVGDEEAKEEKHHRDGLRVAQKALKLGGDVV